MQTLNKLLLAVDMALTCFLKHLGSNISVAHYILHKKQCALAGEKPCINKAIHALLMHGYATFNMIIPESQFCCRYEMCTAWP